MTDWSPVTLLPALQLFLASPTTLSYPETLMAMMEQMSILFDCVRRSEILPQVRSDFFPAVVNGVNSI